MDGLNFHRLVWFLDWLDCCAVLLESVGLVSGLSGLVFGRLVWFLDWSDCCAVLLLVQDCFAMEEYGGLDWSDWFWIRRLGFWIALRFRSKDNDNDNANDNDSDSDSDNDDDNDNDNVNNDNSDKRQLQQHR